MKTKTKITVAVVSVLSVVALAGTGYAGWVLSHNVEGSTKGNMTAYGVADKTVTLNEITFQGGKNSIIWGKAAKKDDVKGTWFGYTNDVEDEFFIPVLSFTITNHETDDYAEPVIESATITVTDDEKGNYSACLTDNLIKGPEVGKNVDIKIPTPTLVETKTNAFTYTMPLVDTAGVAFFGWGSHFAGTDGNPVNPINFYNSKDANDTNADGSKRYEDAQKKMGKIALLQKGVQEGVQEGVHFDIRLVVNHAALSENKE